ncbi:hypothetical protein RHS01_01307 [Rhizoctonia solani]|uniref:Uncharacterized protein n=1 Tax=Rhizoctonia solani TaxID=456999 RepID=A0A8H7IMX9_9AGAM|nr:hypothetical protein RHS01_01307 [Rhizoctonia solani]
MPGCQLAPTKNHYYPNCRCRYPLTLRPDLHYLYLWLLVNQQHCVSGQSKEPARGSFKLGEDRFFIKVNYPGTTDTPNTPNRIKPVHTTCIQIECGWINPLKHNTDVEEEYDDDDPEGFEEILCQISIRLDRTVDSNKLPFVLQCYAQWISQSVFEPLKIAYTTKDTISQQFSLSQASRSRLLMISQIMRKLAKHRALDEEGSMLLELLRHEIWQNVAAFRSGQWSENEERENAILALNNTFEFVGMQAASGPLSEILCLIQLAAPVFLKACPSPYPHMSEILLEVNVNLGHFVVVDVASSITTGRPLQCRYHVPWSLEYCDEFIRKREDRGSQWLLGIPDQFLMLLAYMNNLREDAITANTVIDPAMIERIGDDIRAINMLPCESREPTLAILRTVVQECWRQVVLIYLYMALGRTDALDSRVKKAHKSFMKLVNGTKPGRNLDALLMLPATIAGVAATKSTHRHTIISRILSVPKYTNSNTAWNDHLHLLKDVWTRTATEGRAARWDDLREACWRITGV